jgi:hypothetical protein
MNFEISNSTAISNIAVEDNIATVTFVSGSDYDYTVNDVTSFVTELSNVINSKKSVGSFFNKAVKNSTLQPIAA